MSQYGYTRLFWGGAELSVMTTDSDAYALVISLVRNLRPDCRIKEKTSSMFALVERLGGLDEGLI